MNERQSKILKVLYGNDDYITFAEIAEQMQVSVKTVRNDISYIKEYLTEKNTGRVETKPHAGIKLVISREEWNELNGSEDEEREIIFFIIRQLLKNGSLTAQRLAQQYYIGRTQLDKILEKVSEWFFENHILYERRRGKGISIRCSEFHYRIARLELFSEFTDMYAKLISPREAKNAYAPAADYTALCASLDGFEPDAAAKAIMEAEEELGIRFNYLSGIKFLFLVSLCILRSRRGFAPEMPETVKCPADGESGQKFAALVINKLEKHGIMVPEAELGFIAFAADISEIQEFESEESRRRFEGMNIELCRFTVRVVNLASEISGVDLREDRFFVKQMFLQLKVSISRLKYGTICKNQLLPQIKEKYPNMMAVAWFMDNIFENELRLKLNEHEVGFFALQIGGAIERQLAEMKACVVCDYGIGVSQILKEKISRAIPELKIVSVLSGRDIHKINGEECDFIISAAPLDGYRIRHDIIYVGHLLDEHDVKKIDDYMRTCRKRKNKISGFVPNINLFTDELIFPKCRINSKEALLHMICERLESLGYVTGEFEKSVTEREKSTPTDIGNGFAIPHGLGEYVNHSVAVFAGLEKPIEWGSGEPVNAVFLIAFDMNEDNAVKEKITGFYKSLVSFMEDEAECERLKNLTDVKEIQKIFKAW